MNREPKVQSPRPNLLLDWRLLLVILLMLAIPAVYNSYSIYLIGRWPPSENGLPIVAQWQFVQVFIEVLQEALVFPLFFFVGSQRFGSKPELFQRVRDALAIVFLTLFAVLVLFQIVLPFFVEGIQTSTSLKAETIKYLRVQLIATLFLVLNLSLVIVFEVLSKRRLLIALLLIRLAIRILLDALLYGSYPFSLGMGVEGVALASLLTEVLVLFASVILLHKTMGVRLKDWFRTLHLSAVQLFARVSKWIALESSIRNVAYFLVILSLLNQLGSKQIGGYYLSMHLFWSFCLLPINALAELLKAQIGNYADNRKGIIHLITLGLAIGGTVVLVGWSILYFNLTPILRWLNNDPEVVQYADYSFRYLLIPYGLLALNLIADSAFIGTGKTRFLAYQSIATNLLVYGFAYALYWTGHWIPDYPSILLVFSLGILLDTGLTGYYLWRLLGEGSWRYRMINKSE